jgi:hypothetical protein
VSVETKIDDVLANQHAHSLALSKLGHGQELVRREVRSLAIRHAHLEERVTKLEGGAGGRHHHSPSSLPPVESFAALSDTGSHWVVDPVRYASIEAAAGKWQGVTSAAAKVGITVASVFAVIAALLVAASVYDAAKAHPHLMEARP